MLFAGQSVWNQLQPGPGPESRAQRGDRVSFKYEGQLRELKEIMQIQTSQKL